MAKYKLFESGVLDTTTKRCIPNDPSNSHWKAYQKWLSLGNTPDPEKSGADKKAEKREWISNTRDERKRVNFQTTDLPAANPSTHNWQTDVVSVENINSVITLITAGVSLPDGFTYRDADNNDVPMAAADMISLGGQLMVRVNSIYKESWTMKASVDAIADDDVDIDTKLAAINWS